MNDSPMFFNPVELIQAKKDFEFLLKQQPDNSDAHCYLGLIYLQTGDYEQARQKISQAISIKPDKSEYFYYLGLVLETEDRVFEATKYYETALSIKPVYEDAHGALKRSVAQQVILKKALLRYYRLRKIVPPENLLDDNNQLVNFSDDYPKDIVIVVHNQLKYIRQCVDSIFKFTENFQLYLWDNGSEPQTANYLRNIAETENVILVRSETNLGFIIPNNELVEAGKSNFIILLNSDTIVKNGWAVFLIDILKENSEIAQSGYMGGQLDEDGLGKNAGYGFNIDYVSGWCTCLPRSIYNKFGLFDSDNLSFAYGEDADFSLRLKEAGYKIFASDLNRVFHYENVTAKEVKKNRDITETFQNNNIYFKKRWNHYLNNERILLRKKK